LVSIREIKKVLTFPISSRAKDSMIPLITRYTKAGSLYYTDDWFAYTFLPIRGNHVVVTKEKGLPKGRDHLNSIEGFWSLPNTGFINIVVFINNIFIYT
jgi:transposase